jgi:hypothetical protein
MQNNNTMLASSGILSDVSAYFDDDELLSSFNDNSMQMPLHYI